MRKRIVSALMLGAGLVVGAGPAFAGPIPGAPPSAPANPPTWQATVDAAGTDQDAPNITTSGACPAPARNLVGRIFGAGFPSSGMNVIGNSSAGISMEGPFKAGLQQSLRDTRNELPTYTPYSGVYSIVLSCIVPAYPNVPYGNYTVKIDFADAQHWKALPPPSSAQGPIRLPNGQYVPADSQQAKDYAAGSPVASPSAASAGQPSGSSQPKPGNTSNQVAAVRHHSGIPWGAIALMAGGLVVAVGTLVALRPKKR